MSKTANREKRTLDGRSNLEKCGVSCYDLSKPFGAAGTVVAPGVGTIVGAIIGGVLFGLVGDAIGDDLVDWVFELFE
ncbi:MAG: hypothetical protein E7471_01085 [Ruminococcaceae bacterium]|nr:hypothetical protein [Oscillospiraceae bacterium]